MESSWDFDFSTIESELREVEEKRQEEIRQDAEALAKKVVEEKNPMASLPTQDGQSLELHQAIVETFQKKHKLAVDPKKQFQSRKQHQREQRKAKKAEKYKDKLEEKANKRGVSDSKPVKKQRTKHRQVVF